MQNTTNAPSYKEGLEQLTGQLSGMLPEESLKIFDHDARQLQEKHNSPLVIQVGDKAPSFTLPNATGRLVSSEELLKKGKLVIVFYRGTWCPYCNLQLSTYQSALDQIKTTGANLIAISPQTPDQSLSMKEKNQLAFEVLSDAGNTVSRKFTSIFRNADSAVDALGQLGIDFHSYYEDKSGEIAVPAVFVIDSDSEVLLARTEGGDYRNRVEPKEILEALSH
ncbi:peroxiredoxin-like family protein [Aquiflexum sp.]|uniref:peroxiredoxin-like family protein n=1 Tax=Aquiflexum sp. TaxID=1872584 RepID=UPI0035948F44